MSTGSQVPCPDVVWSPDEPAEDQAALARRLRLQQLVHALWHRLPAGVRAIIACDLRRVVLFPKWSPGEITYGHHDEEIFLNRGATALGFEIGPVLTSSLTTQTAGGGVGISRCTALIQVLPEFM
jgi:hypothetical protein